MRTRKRLEAASTLSEDARLAPFAKFLPQTTKLHAESVPHTSSHPGGEYTGDNLQETHVSALWTKMSANGLLGAVGA
jgi:hypothetical protein